MYTSDQFKNTPLKYALDRNSFQCVEELLVRAIGDKQFYIEMQQAELIQLIKSDPGNLSQFFEKAEEVLDQDPHFGKIVDN